MLEGVMIRNGDYYSLASRKPDGSIFAARFPWREIFPPFWCNVPFFRGFPILLESMVNGIEALIFSASLQEEEKSGKSVSSQIALSIAAAIVIALVLFVLAPHFLSLLMLDLGWGSDIEKLGFHLWDGFYKCAIFILYIACIAFVPEIRRLFENHGAEHKVVRAMENGFSLNPARAACETRLHPRCGTTFLLFVICVSIIAQAVILPLCLLLWTPESWLVKHLWSIFIKLLLVAPVSAITYEIIRFGAALPPGPLATLLLWPGLALQALTTREPDENQLEVATVALAYALHDGQSGENL